MSDSTLSKLLRDLGIGVTREVGDVVELPRRA